MFTGLIEEKGRIVSIAKSGNGSKLKITASFYAEVKIGDSVSVNGICLTVTEIATTALCFDVSAETLSRSSLGNLSSGSPVNLERALKLSDRLGGHIVTGHIDGTAVVSGKTESSEHTIFRLTLPLDLSRYIVEKGSVAVDGISLTVNSCDDKGFNVNVIPHTSFMTTLHSKRIGDSVNIECDVIGKYVEKLLGRDIEAGKNLSLAQLLASSGYM